MEPDFVDKLAAAFLKALEADDPSAFIGELADCRTTIDGRFDLIKVASEIIKDLSLQEKELSR